MTEQDKVSNCREPYIENSMENVHLRVSIHQFNSLPTHMYVFFRQWYKAHGLKTRSLSIFSQETWFSLLNCLVILLLWLFLIDNVNTSGPYIAGGLWGPVAPARKTNRGENKTSD